MLRNKYKFNLNVPPPILADTDEEAQDLLMLCLRKIREGAPGFGFDTETTGKKVEGVKSKQLDWMTDTVTYWSLSFKDEAEFARRFGAEGEYLRYCIPGHYFYEFSPLLENPDALLITWNGKYDGHVSYNSGIDIWNTTVYDAMIMGYLYDENLQGDMSLKSRAWDWCGLSMTKFKDLFGDKDPETGERIKEFSTDLRTLDQAKVSDYASYDAYATLRVYEFLKPLLEVQMLAPPHLSDGRSLWDHFIEVEVPMTRVLWCMERRGLGLDVESLEEVQPGMEKEINELARSINKKSGRMLNVNSPLQLQELFFGSGENDLNLEPVKLTGTGKPSTDADVLKKLSMDGHDIARMILDYRGLVKFKGTYIDGLVAMSRYFPDNRIHPSFNQHGAKTGRFSTNNPNCFDAETEILTIRGWVPFPELDEFDIVAQWHEGGRVNFTKPNEVIKVTYSGDMVHVSNKHIDLMMTPNHRCPLRNRKTGDLKTFLAEDYKEDMHQLHGGMYDGDGIDFSDDYLRLIIAAQADGHWRESGGLSFYFNKKRKAKRLEKLLKSCGVTYYTSIDEERTNSAKYKYSIHKEDMPSLRQWIGPERVIGPWVTSLSRKQLDVFCSEIFFWDGYHEGQTMYASAEKRSADWVQIALTLSGRRAQVREYYGSKKVSYQVDHTPRDYSLTTNIVFEEVPHDGPVYCVTVPTGFIIVRRNGKACVSGNSQNMPRPDNDRFGIRKAFISKPGSLLIVGDYEQLEMRIMAHFSRDPSMIAAIQEGKDLHCVTVDRMYPHVSYDDVFTAKKADSPTEDQKELLKLRQHCKTIGFGIIYGLGPPGLAEDLGIEIDEAGDLIHSYLRKAFVGVGNFIDNTHALCAESRKEAPEGVADDDPRYVPYVRTLVGRKRRLPDITHSNYKLKSRAQRQSVNAIIQGSAGDIIKAAMNRIHYCPHLEELKYFPINQIHDELVGEAPEDTAEEALSIIKHYMENPFGEGVSLRVPLPVDIKIVSRWADAK